VAEMCRRLLANPVMETASWEIRSDEQIGQPPVLP
jgi:phosphoribosylformylglycinamidine (FGAM) synthase PurS component